MIKTAVIAFTLTLAAPAMAQSTPAPPEPTVIGGEQAPVLPLNAPRNFICTDGQKATIDYDRPAGILRVVRGGEVLALQELVGVTPPRFVLGSDGADWSGETATILRGFGKKATPVSTCTGLPAAPTAGLMWGTLNKLDRMALPAGTRAKVLLVNAANADAPAVEITSTEITTRGNQVPLHFRLSYDPAIVIPRGNTYRLQARIEDSRGKLMYITDTAQFVLETAEPQLPVELQLVRTGGQ